ncbi:MAG: PIN domain-containing protein [Myxococcota bacterium]
MIGLDTNVLVRYVVRDDGRQAAAATRLIESRCTADEPGVVTLLVMCELVWVLARGYGYERAEISGLIRRILSAEDLHVERSELAWRALNLYEEGKADFADYVIGFCNQEEKAVATYTFDRRTRGCELFRLLST